MPAIITSDKHVALDMLKATVIYDILQWCIIDILRVIFL